MDILPFYLDETAPPIVRKISTQNEGAFDIEPGAEFRLRVRPMWSSTTVLDVAMTADTVADEVSYDPVVGDFDGEGIYRAWIYVDFGAGKVQSTDEFQISVLSHGPGQGTAIGA